MAHVNYPIEFTQTPLFGNPRNPHVLYGLENRRELELNAVRSVVDDSGKKSKLEEKIKRNVVLRAERYAPFEEQERLNAIAATYEQLRNSVWRDDLDRLAPGRQIAVETGKVTERDDRVLEYEKDRPYYLISVIDENSSQLVGFGYGWREKDSRTGELGFYSHYIGLDDQVELTEKTDKNGLAKYLVNFRDAGLGKEIKDIIHGIANKESLKYIEWTVDPLLGENSNLNFNVFGASVVSFESNKYGFPGQMKGENEGKRLDRWTMRKYVDPNFNHHLLKKTEQVSQFQSYHKDKKETRNADFRRIIERGRLINDVALVRTYTPDPSDEFSLNLNVLDQPYERVIDSLNQTLSSLDEVASDTLLNDMGRLGLSLKVLAPSAKSSETDNELGKTLLDKLKFDSTIDSETYKRDITVKLVRMYKQLDKLDKEDSERELLFRVPFDMRYLFTNEPKLAREWQIISALVFDELVNEKGYEVGFISIKEPEEMKFPWSERSNYYYFKKPALDKEVPTPAKSKKIT